MKKLIIITICFTFLLSGCNSGKINELDKKILDLETLVSERDITISSLRSENKELKDELSIYTYTPGTPKVTGTPFADPTLIENFLIELDSKITGKVTDAICYDSGSVSFYVTTDKGGKYNGFLTSNSELTEVTSITIYLSSEFCYSWLNESLWPVGTGEWILDSLSGGSNG